MRPAVNAAVLLCFATLLHAQAADTSSPPHVDSASTKNRERLIDGNDARRLVEIGASALIVGQFDQRITHAATASGLQSNSFLHNGAADFNRLGDPGAIVIAVGTYAVGRVFHSEHLADLGFHVGESLVAVGIETWVVKGIVGRRRPYASIDDADYFAFGHGFNDNTRESFPSGHTSAAFAAAAAATQEVRHWWPNSPWFVGPVMYGGAAMVGLARIYTENHWTSDVIVGAGLGTLTGLKVVALHHGRIPSSSKLTPKLFAVPGGLGVGWDLLTSGQ